MDKSREIAFHAGCLMGLIKKQDPETMEYFNKRGYCAYDFKKLEEQLRNLAEVFYYDDKKRL